jgi:hypothetical protein
MNYSGFQASCHNITPLTKDFILFSVRKHILSAAVIIRKIIIIFNNYSVKHGFSRENAITEEFFEPYENLVVYIF